MCAEVVWCGLTSIPRYPNKPMNSATLAPHTLTRRRLASVQDRAWSTKNHRRSGRSPSWSAAGRARLKNLAVAAHIRTLLLAEDHHDKDAIGTSRPLAEPPARSRIAQRKEHMRSGGGGGNATWGPDVLLLETTVPLNRRSG